MFNCIIAKAMKKEGGYFALELRDPVELLGGRACEPEEGGRLAEEERLGDLL